MIPTGSWLVVDPREDVEREFVMVVPSASFRVSVAVGQDLSLPDHPEAFVVGDIAWITEGEGGEALLQLGSVAMQSGEHAGETIKRRLVGKQTEPFSYRDKGTMATIGRGAAVIQMPAARP